MILHAEAAPKTPKSGREERADAPLSQIPEEDPDDDDNQTQFTESSAPILTTAQYSRYLRSLIKLLVGETTLNDWIRKGNSAAVVKGVVPSVHCLVNCYTVDAAGESHLQKFKGSDEIIILAILFIMHMQIHRNMNQQILGHT